AALALLGGIYFSQAADAKAADSLNKRWQQKQSPILRDKARFETSTATVKNAQGDLDVAFKPGQHLSDALMAASNDVPQGVWLTGASAERGKLL
ncbi:hypothetical protein ACHM2U_16110, partial [Clostridium perfringens]|uniref:hypothetical protein n=1 Tax=Clostridium perfringens TaxID=1502 RepID=UPI003755125D